MDSASITVEGDGPYLVRGGVPLSRRRIVRSEQGEALVWRTEEVTERGGTYRLCRCGGSSTKPFCDGSHADDGFDGTESGPTDDYQERARAYPGTGMTLHDDRGLCAHASFCATKQTNAWKMMRETEDTATRSHAMAMVERCPSGAITYDVDGERNEPDLPVRVNVIEDGPLFVSGGVPVSRADGAPLETRNRMALCRCGASSNKPFCDGTHVEVGFEG